MCSIRWPFTIYQINIKSAVLCVPQTYMGDMANRRKHYEGQKGTYLRIAYGACVFSRTHLGLKWNIEVELMLIRDDKEKCIYGNKCVSWAGINSIFGSRWSENKDLLSNNWNRFLALK